MTAASRKAAVRALLLLLSLNILLVGVRGIWRSAYVPRLVQADAVSYDTAARNMLAGRGFSICDQFPYLPDSFRTPLYPAVLAGLYALVGARPWLMIPVQCLLSLLTLWLFVQATVLLFDEAVARVGAYMWALSPLLLTCVHSLITETLFLTFFVAGWLCWLLFVRQGRWRTLAGAGVLLGVAILARPAAQYVPLVLAPLSAWAAWRRWHARGTALAVAGVLLVTSGAIVAPWLARNYRVFGVWKLSTADGCHYFTQSAVLTLRAQFGQPADVTRGALYDGFFRHYALCVTQESYMALYWGLPSAACTNASLLAGVHGALGPAPAGGPVGLSNYVAMSRAQLQTACAVITRYPLAYARCVARSITQLLLTPPWQEVMRLVYPDVDAHALALALVHRDWPQLAPMPRGAVMFGIVTAAITTAFSIGIVMLALVGVVRLVRGNTDVCIKLACILVPGYFVAVTGGYGEARYRVAMLPIMVALAARGFVWLRDRRRC